MKGSEKPLAGKRIVVTRAPEQARELTRALESLGAQVILFPTVCFAPPEDWHKLDEQLRHLDLFEAILFLSKNAVRYIFDRCAELGIKCEMVESSNRFIAAVGPATAQALTEKGLRVDCVAKNYTGESLVRELRESLAGRRVLLPRSDRGDDRVPDALREIGASVTEVIAYRTVAPAALDPTILARVRGGEVDAVVFASPSAFRNLRDSVGRAEIAQLSARIQFVAIGPTTSRAIRESGSRVAIEADETSAVGLAAALAKNYRQDSSAARPA
ncbi:MAG: uroporphyrinogen-III synthase [Candidatus Acidiferrales bacterium]|jgi:uroporphyrinogen-III synthase